MTHFFLWMIFVVFVIELIGRLSWLSGMVKIPPRDTRIIALDCIANVVLGGMALYLLVTV